VNRQRSSPAPGSGFFGATADLILFLNKSQDVGPATRDLGAAFEPAPGLAKDPVSALMGTVIGMPQDEDYLLAIWDQPSSAVA
jgi:hypothetical protein